MTVFDLNMTVFAPNMTVFASNIIFVVVFITLLAQNVTVFLKILPYFLENKTTKVTTGSSRTGDAPPPGEAAPRIPPHTPLAPRSRAGSARAPHNQASPRGARSRSRSLWPRGFPGADPAIKGAF